MNELHKSVEHLYLFRDDKSHIYVNNCEILRQHQIDGLRFLFKQFQKKSPGVIINFPPACGKSVTVALFLNAIKSLLKYPVLILCNHNDEMQYWKEQFVKWTDYNEDHIAVESTNPFIKDKKVFLKRPESLNSYLRRRWSIIIIKAEIAHKEMLKFLFETDFKIWLTSTDMKKDLSMLSLVYAWLNPKSKLDINDFVAKDPKEKFHKSILLDTFLEECLIRENTDLEPFRTDLKPDTCTEINERKRSKVSVKNKDATGTKIKRSRRILTDDILSASNNNQNASTDHKENDFSLSTHDNANDHKFNNDLNVINDHDSPKLDVENFIREQKPLQPVNHNDLDDLSRFCDKEETKMEYQGTSTSNVNEKCIQDEQSTESLSFNDFEADNEMNGKHDACDNQNNAKDNNFIDNLENGSKAYLNTKDLNHSEFVQIKSNNNEMKSKIANDNEIKPKHKDIDVKLSEMEEQAFKKYKGSILDSIF